MLFIVSWLMALFALLLKTTRTRAAALATIVVFAVRVGIWVAWRVRVPVEVWVVGVVTWRRLLVRVAFCFPHKRMVAGGLEW